MHGRNDIILVGHDILHTGWRKAFFNRIFFFFSSMLHKDKGEHNKPGIVSAGVWIGCAWEFSRILDKKVMFLSYMRRKRSSHRIIVYSYKWNIYFGCTIYLLSNMEKSVQVVASL